MQIVEKRKIWFTISLVLILIGIIAMPINALMGNGILNFDVEFSGGIEIQMDLGQEFDNNDVTKIVKDITNQSAPQVQRILGKQQVNIKIRQLENTEETDIEALFEESFKEKYPQADVLSYSNVSATISSEMQVTALVAVLIACVAMLLYITIRFGDWRSGVSAIIALVHDVLIVLMVYSVVRVPVNNSFIAAILTIVGYSINNTIVIFDRIRENKNISPKKTDFIQLTNKSIKDTLTRSINTSLTTLFTVVALYVFGVASIKEFAMPMIVGMLAGTYSSIFISTSVWYVLNTKKKAD